MRKGIWWCDDLGGRDLKSDVNAPVLSSSFYSSDVHYTWSAVYTPTTQQVAILLTNTLV